jgi:hypothetical protein
MPHPHVRTWTLATLDPGQQYRLWLDPETFRWEVCLLEDEAQDRLTTRTATDGGSGALAKARQRRVGVRPPSAAGRDGTALSPTSASGAGAVRLAASAEPASLGAGAA